MWRLPHASAGIRLIDSCLNQHVQATPRIFVMVFEHYCTLSGVKDADHLGKQQPNLVK